MFAPPRLGFLEESPPPSDSAGGAALEAWPPLWSRPWESRSLRFCPVSVWSGVTELASV
eukprot:CAMPEP_0118926500 /NCGR_PEP_ID=MMETSP1169-20130426/4171_1 /TAXON_ID=36882 /ORGANISM="Pyramimonas obovata, Strain CCMP722" /LENGTH=58 /DNA_ID=CAMNT_0006868061 /DNA_START=214 /DNA_END=390 /DNA_ORIENTATION=+